MLCAAVVAEVVVVEVGVARAGRPAACRLGCRRPRPSRSRPTTAAAAAARRRVRPRPRVVQSSWRPWLPETTGPSPVPGPEPAGGTVCVCVCVCVCVLVGGRGRRGFVDEGGVQMPALARPIHTQSPLLPHPHPTPGCRRGLGVRQERCGSSVRAVWRAARSGRVRGVGAVEREGARRPRRACTGWEVGGARAQRRAGLAAESRHARRRCCVGRARRGFFCLFVVRPRRIE
jgi:hypothetical protein